MKKSLVSALLAGLLLATPLSSQAATSKAWTGVDFGPDSYFVYLGGVTGLSSQDIHTQDGWLLRGSVGFGNYDYDTVAVPGGNVDSDVRQGDVMVGYGHNFSNGRISAYLGGEIQNHDPSPNDPNNSVDGTQGGVKGQLELEAKPAQDVELWLVGNYSTSFDSYWTHGFVGYDFGPVTIGPELGFTGNEEYNQVRYGVSAGGLDLGFVDARAYAGYANTNGQGDDGMYGGVSFGKAF